jgi:signal transduction histidine kinase
VGVALTSRGRRWTVAGWAVAVLAATLAVSLLLGDLLVGDLTAEEIPLAFAFFAFAAVGAVLMLRVPGHRLGPLFAFIGLAPMVGAAVETFVPPLLEPGSPLVAISVMIGEALWTPTLVVVLVIPALLFPTGRPPSRRWAWVGWAALLLAVGFAALIVFRPEFTRVDRAAGTVTVANPIGIAGLPDPEESLLADVGFLALGLLAVLALASLVVRYRRADAERRAQLKLLLSAVALLVGWVVALIMVPRLDEWAGSNVVFPLLLAAIPVSAAIAILRYRLYDVDLVISKTLAYGALAVFITLVYVAVVVGVGTVVGGTGNLVLSIVATAIVAVAFQPVRELVQRFANRVVYGKRATPYEVLSELSGRMAYATATEELLPRIARMVAEGIGAARVEVWLRVGSDLLLEAEWSDPTTTSLGSPVVAGDEVSVAGADAAVPVRHQGELLGVISVSKPRGDPINPAELKLLEDLASQAGLVLRNVRLVEELRSSRQRLVKAQDEERRRLERDLHDGAQQRLVSIALGLRMARGLVAGDADGRLGERLDQASEELSLALGELRDLARGIHPAMLTDRGLVPALASLLERSALPATMESTLAGRLSTAVEATAYFVVAEGLTNAAKYSEATAVRVRLEYGEGWLRVEVSDDGVGGADPSRGSGLRGLGDRVEAVGGVIEIVSPPGQGTTLVCRIPAETAPSAASTRTCLPSRRRWLSRCRRDERRRRGGVRSDLGHQGLPHR